MACSVGSRKRPERYCLYTLRHELISYIISCLTPTRPISSQIYTHLPPNTPHCFGVIVPSGTGAPPCCPKSSSPLSPLPCTGFVSCTGNVGSPKPSGFGGVLVPGPPLRSQSFQEPRYSPTFSYLRGLALAIIPLLKERGYNIPSLSRNPRRGTTPHPCLAEEHNLLVQRGLRKVEPIQEFFFAQQQRIGLRRHGNVDRGWNAVHCKFVWLAHVDNEAGRGGGFEDGKNLGVL
jgi:hypothetical protein